MKRFSDIITRPGLKWFAEGKKFLYGMSGRKKETPDFAIRRLAVFHNTFSN